MESEDPWATGQGRRLKGKSELVALELCAGAGGQAIGLEQSGIGHVGLLEINPHACSTLRLNRPEWRVIQNDLNEFDAAPFAGAEIVAAGLPCPPFSVAGKQLGPAGPAQSISGDDQGGLQPSWGRHGLSGVGAMVACSGISLSRSSR
jgi:hypothetical protein